MYRVTGELQEAERFAFLALKHAEEFEFSANIAPSSMLLAFILNQKDYNYIKYYLRKVFDACMETKDFGGVAVYYNTMASMSLNNKAETQAMSCIDSALTLSEVHNRMRLTATAYFIKSEIF
jgi:hypothetical protein